MSSDPECGLLGHRSSARYFRDNAQALADGRLGPDGIFEANKIQAKCASKYEAKPLQRGLSHESPGTKISSVQPARVAS